MSKDVKLNDDYFKDAIMLNNILNKLLILSIITGGFKHLETTNDGCVLTLKLDKPDIQVIKDYFRGK